MPSIENITPKLDVEVRNLVTETKKLQSIKSTKLKLNRTERRRAAPIGIDLNSDSFLRLNNVLAIYPLLRRTCNAGIKDDIYPNPVQLGKRTVGWSRKSIRDLVAKPPEF